jgi:predicted kinase
VAILHTQSDPQVLRQRIARRAATDSDASEAGLEVLAHQIRSQEPLSAEELSYTVAVDTESLQPPDQAQQTKEIIERLRRVARRP